MRISLVLWLSFILYYWVCLSFDASMVFGFCLDDQKLLLLQMKKDLRFDSASSSKLVIWNESLPCSQWRGVTWDEEGHVTGLDLSEESILGGFDNSSSLFDLQYLENLNLAHNNFNSVKQIPVEISNLRHLSVLNISECQLNGYIPDSMSNLTELTVLDLSLNRITGPIPSFALAKNLALIDLSNNKLSGEIPLSLFSLPLLETMDLQNNHLQGQLNAISNVSSSMLQILDLSGNHFEGPIPQFIFHLKQLKFLQLSSNKFNGTIQLDMIWRLENLDTLGLSNMDLSVDADVEDTHLLSFPKMSSVYLASCKLRQFPAFLRNQSRLQKLDLSNNQIAGKIPNWIWKIGNLAELNLSHNAFHEIERPPYDFDTYLHVLDLHCNDLQGTFPTFVSADFLDYSFNKFNFVIPPDIGDYLSSTFSISLSHNALHGRIPDSICNSRLLVLDLSFNNFNGIIPPCLAQSDALEVLNLGKNNLSGNIPDTFQASCVLETLDLSSNNLHGPVPKSLSNCTKLDVLNLGNNRIEDKFPCFLETLYEIRVLVLRKNYFYGPIGCPKTKGIWNMLQIFDLAFNNFNGTLPGKSFLTWKAMMLTEYQIGLELIDFHFVQAVDPLNPSRPVLPNQRNGIYRIIDWHQVEVKYQDHVMVTFKGQEMPLSKILTFHTFIDFSSNHFEGSIPEEMMEFRALHSLNLSNNHLSGHIPSSIWKMKQLESLDLFNNSFTGEIPSQLASLSFLDFLNLSNNHLFGEIPTGTQIQSFPASSFVGNIGLCGPPLTKNCSADRRAPTKDVYEKYSGIQFDWHFVLSGAVFGLGIIVGPLFYWKKWRIRYWKLVDNILCSIFPRLYHEYQWHHGQAYEVLRWRH